MAKRGLSSVQRTLRACREQGRFIEKVEQWISYGGHKAKPKPGMPSGTRRDAFGFIDIIAIDTDAIIAIQACGADRKSHYDKIIESDYSLPWLKAGGRIELWSWTKRKVKRGGKQVRWFPKIENIKQTDFLEGISSNAIEELHKSGVGEQLNFVH